MGGREEAKSEVWMKWSARGDVDLACAREPCRNRFGARWCSSEATGRYQSGLSVTAVAVGRVGN